MACGGHSPAERSARPAAENPDRSSPTRRPQQKPTWPSSSCAWDHLYCRHDACRCREGEEQKRRKRTTVNSRRRIQYPSWPASPPEPRANEWVSVRAGTGYTRSVSRLLPMLRDARERSLLSTRSFCFHTLEPHPERRPRSGRLEGWVAKVIPGTSHIKIASTAPALSQSRPQQRAARSRRRRYGEAEMRWRSRSAPCRSVPAVGKIFPVKTFHSSACFWLSIFQDRALSSSGCSIRC